MLLLPLSPTFIPKSLIKVLEKLKDFRTERSFESIQSAPWFYQHAALMVIRRYIQSPPCPIFPLLLLFWTWLHSIIFHLSASPPQSAEKVWSCCPRLWEFMSHVAQRALLSVPFSQTHPESSCRLWFSLSCGLDSFTLINAYRKLSLFQGQNGIFWAFPGGKISNNRICMKFEMCNFTHAR